VSLENAPLSMPVCAPQIYQLIATTKAVRTNIAAINNTMILFLRISLFDDIERTIIILNIKMRGTYF